MQIRGALPSPLFPCFANSGSRLINIGVSEQIILHLLFIHSLGDKVIVGLNSDASVTRIKRTPVNNQEWRREFLQELECVDDVIIFEEDTPWQLIQQIKPDILVKGGDYTLSEVVGAELVDKVVIFPLTIDISTTKIINHANHNN